MERHLGDADHKNHRGTGVWRGEMRNASVIWASVSSPQRERLDEAGTVGWVPPPPSVPIDKPSLFALALSAFVSGFCIPASRSAGCRRLKDTKLIGTLSGE